MGPSKLDGSSAAMYENITCVDIEAVMNIHCSQFYVYFALRVSRPSRPVTTTTFEILDVPIIEWRGQSLTVWSVARLK